VLILDNQYEVFFFEYFKKQGYSKQQMYQFVKHNKFNKKAYGIYTLKGQNPEPLSYIEAYERQCNKRVYVGALSALRLHGVSQNIPFNTRYQIYYNEQRINRWLLDQKDYIWTRNNLFNSSVGITKKNNLSLSSPERAILEAISLLPKQGDFEEVYHTLLLLPSLRPQLLMDLICECKSIKTKRLFLYMLKHVNFTWKSKLDLSKVDIGKGIRQLYPEGKLDPDYHLYVPEIHDEV